MHIFENIENIKKFFKQNEFHCLDVYMKRTFRLKVLENKQYSKCSLQLPVSLETNYPKGKLTADYRHYS